MIISQFINRPSDNSRGTPLVSVRTQYFRFDRDSLICYQCVSMSHLRFVRPLRIALLQRRFAVWISKCRLPAPSSPLSF